MEIDRYEPGVPSWIDVGSPDPQGTADFYGALFGWEAPEGPPETGGYRVAMVGDRAVAGIGAGRTPVRRSGPPTSQSRAPTTPRKVLAAGGQVVVPAMDVLDVGRMAVFSRSAARSSRCGRPGTHPGAQLVNEPGTWSWSELLTTDIEASKKFYGAVFGWTRRRRTPGRWATTPMAGRAVDRSAA